MKTEEPSRFKFEDSSFNDDKPREACGIFGIYDHPEAAALPARVARRPDRPHPPARSGRQQPGPRGADPATAGAVTFR